MPKRQSQKAVATPKAGRPKMQNYGIRKIKLTFYHGSGRESACARAGQYWIATTRPDGSPHLMVIWGLWMEDGFYFSTGRPPAKAAIWPKTLIV